MSMSFQPIQEHQIASLNGTTADRVDIDTLDDEFMNQRRVAHIRVETNDATVIFGDSTVDADDTLTSNDLAAGNFTVKGGETKAVKVPESATHISILGTAADSAYVTIGFMA